MKKFFFFFLNVVIICIVLSIAMDFVYTTIYMQCNNRRKIGYIYNSKPKTIDVVILGSSRANNHFVTSMFTEKELTAFNFGMQGSRLFESDLILKLLLERKNVIRNVIVEVDLNLRCELGSYSEANVLKFLPYLHGSHAVNKHLRNLPDYKLVYYLPFYRYMKYENNLGFREFFLSGINKKSKELDDGGYNLLEPSKEKLEGNLLNTEPCRNKYYEEIKRICKINKIRLITVMTPMCKNTTGSDYFNKVQKLYPEIYNYENVVKEDKYFSSCGHMDDAGAKIFTAIILKDFFNK